MFEFHGGGVATLDVAQRATARWERRSLPARIVAVVDLDSVPWNLLVSAVLGAWLIAAPAVPGDTGAAAHSNHLAGALVVTWAVIAFGEVARAARLLNILLRMWIVGASWLLSGATDLPRWIDLFAGVLLIALAIRRGRIDI